jgi:hypothetical protein
MRTLLISLAMLGVIGHVEAKEHALPAGLNSSWIDRELWNGGSADLSNVLLSASGYPMIAIVQDWAVCESPFLVREANDAMKAGRREWANKIPGCIVLPRDTLGEWTKERVIDDVLEFRFEATGNERPLTLYGPSRSAAGVPWLGLRVRREGSNTEGCKPTAYRDWFHDCSIIFHVAANVPIAPDAAPTKLIIAYDGDAIRVLAAMTLDEYRRFFTRTPPAITAFQAPYYVADEQFFNKRFPPVLRVNGENITLEWDGTPHWRIPIQYTNRVMGAFKTGTPMELEYTDFSRGGGQRAVVSASGFVEALAASGIGDGR